MQNKIKNKLEKTLSGLIRDLDKRHSMHQSSPVLLKQIKEFVFRKGKRLRPLLFVIGYLGFAKRACPNLYKSALSIELLHDFFLIHDDIIDKSDTRRGRPAMHKILGQDLAIIAGDMMYALAIDTFLSIKEELPRKEKALKRFIQAAIFTGMGEFLELLTTRKDIRSITKENIFRIYDYKTAWYTFAAPVSCGAILAGAGADQINKLCRYGIYLGRAFQIKDDILGMFGKEKEIGKSVFTDLQEAKKTLLIWYAYQHTNQRNKVAIKRILTKNKVNKSDLLKMRKIIIASGALVYASNEISSLLKKAQLSIETLTMRTKFKDLLKDFSRQLFK